MRDPKTKCFGNKPLLTVLCLAAVCFLIVPSLLSSNLVFSETFSNKIALKEANKVFREGDYSKAHDSYMDMAKEGDPYAQLNLGFMYFYDNYGISQDYKEALKWFSSAAEANLDVAQYMIGIMSLYGLGTNEDHQNAAKWFRLAADQGNSKAQLFLGELYFYGKGVEHTLYEAANWFRYAARQGEPEAQYYLGAMNERGDGVPVNLKKAESWYRQAANRGYAMAQHRLASMYASGLGVPINFTKAEKWYRLAAEQGFGQSQLGIGFLFLYGKGVPQSYVNAYAWCRIASQSEGEKAEKCVDISKQEMTPDQFKAAEMLTKEIRRQIKQPVQ